MVDNKRLDLCYIMLMRRMLLLRSYLGADVQISGEGVGSYQKKIVQGKLVRKKSCATTTKNASIGHKKILQPQSYQE